jgi:CBS domain-containing protein
MHLKDLLLNRKEDKFWDLRDDQSVGEACRLIHEHHGIHAIPVYRMEPQAASVAHSKSYYAMLESKHLLCFILSRRLLDPDDKIMSMQISEVALQVKLQGCRVFDVDDPLSELLQHFAKDATPVLINDGSKFQFLSPLDCLSLVKSRRMVTGRALIRRELIHLQESALVTADKLVLSPYSALPIVEKDEIIGNVSVSDFFVTQDPLHTLARLHEPLSTFLGPMDFDHAICSHQGFTATQIIDKLLRFQIHQLYYKAAASEVCIITLGDLFPREDEQ